MVLIKPVVESKPEVPAADLEDGGDGTGEPAATLLNRWTDARGSACVLELEASMVATWGRQLARAHFDLRAVKVFDLPMQTSNASTRNYVVSVRAEGSVMHECMGQPRIFLI